MQIKDKAFVVALKGCIILGALLAIFQFIYNRSLWLDEASLALNILERSYLGLFSPLSYQQAAPVGFLIVEKAIVSILGANEFSLRLFPLFGFLVSILCYYLFARNSSEDKNVAFISVAIFSLTLSMIRYATEAKQYMIDIMIVVTFLAIVTSPLKNIRSRILLLSVLGILAVWLSHISVIILFVIGIDLLRTNVFRQAKYIYVLPFSLWIVSFLLNYFLCIDDHPVKSQMQKFWAEYFMPLNPFSAQFYQFAVHSVKSVYAYLLGFQWMWYVPFLISLFGLFSWFQRKAYRILYFCLAPLVIHLILSALRLYPFDHRLILYLIPLAILVYASGLIQILEVCRARFGKIPSTVLLIPVIAMLIPVTMNYPLEKQEIKEALRYIEQHIKPGERVYVYHGSQRPVMFYQRIGYTSLEDQIIFGSRSLGNNSLYDSEIDDLKGRVWMIFSQVYAESTIQTEETYMIDLLLRNGGQVIDKFTPTGVRCYYVDTR